MNKEGHEIIDRILVMQVEGNINISSPPIVQLQEIPALSWWENLDIS